MGTKRQQYLVDTIMKKALRIGILFLALLSLSSCSLFKFTVSVGDKPLSEADLNTRVMVRSLYNDFTRTVIAASDSISARTNSIGIKINALQWKMRSSAACADAAYGGVPEVSLINTWVLCQRMYTMMEVQPDSLLFGSQTPIARDASLQLLGTISTLATKLLTEVDFQKMQAFVSDYSNNHPMNNLQFVNVNLMLEWTESQTISNKNYVKSIGSIPEVMADMNERISGYSTQFGNELSWSKQMFSLEMEQDSIKNKLTIKLDSISQSFNRMVVVFEHSPQIVNAITNNLSKQMQELIGVMNSSVNSAFYSIANERQQLQEFFNAQREVLMQEIQQNIDVAIKTTMSTLPSLIGKIVIYLVLGLSLLFCVPFFAGFMLGRWRERKKTKNEDK